MTLSISDAMAQIPAIIKALDEVPQSLATMLMLAFCFVVFYAVKGVKAWSLRKKEAEAEASGEKKPKATSTHGAVEELRGVLMPDLDAISEGLAQIHSFITANRETEKATQQAMQEVRDALRDVAEELHRVADIEIGLAGKLETNTAAIAAASGQQATALQKTDTILNGLQNTVERSAR